MHLVGFIIRIYYDARSLERRQIRRGYYVCTFCRVSIAELLQILILYSIIRTVLTVSALTALCDIIQPYISLTHYISVVPMKE